MTYSDGKYFEGEWKIGRINGQGTLYSSNGSVIYEGQWQDGKFHGNGTLYNQKPMRVEMNEQRKTFDRATSYWTKYQGNFRNDQWEGKGELLLGNGDIYVGEFKRDAPHGKGKCVYANGKVLEGEWQNCQLIKVFN